VHFFARGVCFGAAPVRVVEIRKHGHVLTPGRYVGAEAQAEAAKLHSAIAANLKELGYGE
jgi:hypothetical protein